MKKKSAILLSLAALALSVGAVGAIATGTDLLSATPVAVKAADEQAEELALVFPDDNKAKNTVGLSPFWCLCFQRTVCSVHRTQMFL